MLELDADRGHLEALKLSTAADVLESRLQQAAEKQLTYVAFLADLLGEEVAQRHKRNIQTKIRMARLPYQKTLAEFDFSFQPRISSTSCVTLVKYTEIPCINASIARATLR